jgi:hypothetical protein
VLSDVEELVEDDGDWLVEPLRVVDEDDDGLVDELELSVADAELLELPALEPDCVWLDVVCALSARVAEISATVLEVTSFRGIFMCDFALALYRPSRAWCALPGVRRAPPRQVRVKRGSRRASLAPNFRESLLGNS